MLIFLKNVTYNMALVSFTGFRHFLKTNKKNTSQRSPLNSTMMKYFLFRIKFHHYFVKCVLTTTTKTLPKWGFEQVGLFRTILNFVFVYIWKNLSSNLEVSTLDFEI